jgi:spermidine synthase
MGTAGLVALSALLLTLPTLALGATFALVTLIDEHDRGGFLYAVDLLGAVIGSFLTGFILIPGLGVNASVLVAGLISTLAGLVVQRSPYNAMLGVALITLISITGAAHDHEISYSDELANKSDEGVQDNRTLSDESGEQATRGFYRQTKFGTIQTFDDWLLINRVPQCSFNFTYQQGKSERLLADLSIGSQDVSRVANVGLGCASTLDRILNISDGIVDVIEINPAVRDINKQRHDMLSSSRVNTIIEDGYLHFQTTNQEYDSVMIDVPNPSIVYSSNLYTEEMFESVFHATDEEGTVGMWIPSSHDNKKTQRVYQIIGSTLSKIYPHVYKEKNVLIGSKTPINNSASAMNVTTDDVNTVNKNILSRHYSEECSWDRRQRFKELLPGFY